MDYSLLEEHDGRSTHDDQQDVEPEPLRSFEHQPRFASRQRHPDHGRSLNHDQRDQRSRDQVTPEGEHHYHARPRPPPPPPPPHPAAPTSPHAAPAPPPPKPAPQRR